MRFALTLFLTLAGGVAFAECPSKSPKVSKSSLASGDKRVNAAWLEKTLAGRRVVFPSGEYEEYFSNGSYAYRSGGNSWKAESYKFYDTGMRCIGYDTPRFDLHVVNDGQLVLVNKNKDRYVGRIK